MSFMGRLLDIVSLRAIFGKPQARPFPSEEGLKAVSLPLFGGVGGEGSRPCRKPFGRRRKIHELQTGSGRRGQVGEPFDLGFSRRCETAVLPFPRTSYQEKS